VIERRVDLDSAKLSVFSFEALDDLLLRSAHYYGISA
jgi:hypothetical protein